MVIFFYCVQAFWYLFTQLLLMFINIPKACKKTGSKELCKTLQLTIGIPIQNIQLVLVMLISWIKSPWCPHCKLISEGIVLLHLLVYSFLCTHQYDVISDPHNKMAVPMCPCHLMKIDKVCINAFDSGIKTIKHEQDVSTVCTLYK